MNAVDQQIAAHAIIAGNHQNYRKSGLLQIVLRIQKIQSKLRFPVLKLLFRNFGSDFS